MNLSACKRQDYTGVASPLPKSYGEIETNPNDYSGMFYAKTPIKDRLDFKSSLHK